ncbi:Crp/Fnr family transcriptional regulator, partial [Gordoniibacillus kamchatkensis]|uniref:Crp/Fnr family transcriptional regulator n=1 Tax=Gordoniibacillus kamchatkensis TaxID=1590651 RepID=UPI001E49A2E0
YEDAGGDHVREKSGGGIATCFGRGDEAGKLYFIRSGRVKLTKTTEEGRTLNLSLMQKGDLIGEIGLTGSGTYGYSAEMAEAGELGVVQEKDLEILLFRHGEFASTS